jgi:hypothetical protein
MGDGVNVLITVRLEDGDKTREILTKTDGAPSDHYDRGGFDHLFFDEVNYDNLNGLKQLAEAGIPFDSAWGINAEFSNGTLYSRYTDSGGLIQFEVYDTEINPDIHRLLKLIDNYKELKEYILIYKERTTPLPWETQEKNSKLFRAIRLIAPATTNA